VTRFFRLFQNHRDGAQSRARVNVSSICGGASIRSNGSSLEPWL